MDASPAALVKLLLPKTPFIFKTALCHALSLSATSSKWDLRTELTVSLLRDLLCSNTIPRPISTMQHLTTQDSGVKGKVWVSKVTLPVPPEDDVRQLLFHAIDEMSTGGETWAKCESRGLEAEWNGYRASAHDQEPEPPCLSETQKYENLLAETSSNVTILYFHGGAMYLMDPATYRPTTSRLAQETGGRVFNVRYRLSPQHPFPAALLDCLTAYLSLLSPPPGAPHAAVPAREIIFGGDSAGATLCTALLQLLLHLQRRGAPSTLLFHDQTLASPLPLPAALALTSPWLDLTRSLPSLESTPYIRYDYLPPPSLAANTRIPPCPAWPTTPPRADLYCDGPALLHPLVSPLAAKSWSASPPIFISVGQEMLRDEIAVFAQRLAAQRVALRWREFEAMPHCFAMLLPHCPGTPVHFDEYARFCSERVQGATMETEGLLVAARSLERRVVDVRAGLTGLRDEEVDALMDKGRKAIEARMRRGEETRADVRLVL